MKVIAIFEVNEEQVIGTYCGGCVSPDNLRDNLEDIIKSELGWVEESGIAVKEVIAEDSIPPNDADLGALVRPYLQN